MLHYGLSEEAEEVSNQTVLSAKYSWRASKPSKNTVRAYCLLVDLLNSADPPRSPRHTVQPNIDHAHRALLWILV